MFLCFHVCFKHESTKTCMFPCLFRAYFALITKGLLSVSEDLRGLSGLCPGSLKQYAGENVPCTWLWEAFDVYSYFIFKSSIQTVILLYRQHRN